jgi:rhamnosyl/mannosyltransferase
MYWWLKERSFDIIHLHTPNPLAEMIYLLARPRGKLVVSYHADPQKAAGLMRMYRPLAERILGQADAISVASPHHYLPGTGLQDHVEKCHVIPFGIDLSPFASPEGEDKEAEAWREKMGGPFALFVGRLVPYKGLLALMEALRPTPHRLAIVGSGPLHANLQQLRAGMEDRVRLLGSVSDEELPSLYRAARFLVLPSLDASEAFGMVQLESFAAGRPVLASDLPTGVSWVNSHEETGLLAPPGDVVALRNALRRLFEEEGLADRLGDGALARARSIFSREHFGSKTMDMYQQLLSEGA